MAAFSGLKLSFGDATASIKHNIESSNSFFLPFPCIKSIFLPAEGSSDWNTCRVSHQQPSEFVRQNLKWCPFTSCLLREVWTCFLQATSESVPEACGISIQEESDLQLLKHRAWPWEGKSGGRPIWKRQKLDTPVVGWGTRHPCVVRRHETRRLSCDNEVVTPELELWRFWKEARDSEHPPDRRSTHRNQTIISYLQRTRTPSALARVLPPPRSACNPPFGAAYTVWRYWEENVVSWLRFTQTSCMFGISTCVLSPRSAWCNRSHLYQELPSSSAGAPGGRRRWLPDRSWSC